MNSGENMNRWWQEHVWNWQQKSNQKSIQVILVISPNNLCAWTRERSVSSILTRKSQVLWSSGSRIWPERVTAIILIEIYIKIKKIEEPNENFNNTRCFCSCPSSNKCHCVRTTRNRVRMNSQGDNKNWKKTKQRRHCAHTLGWPRAGEYRPGRRPVARLRATTKMPSKWRTRGHVLSTGHKWQARAGAAATGDRRSRLPGTRSDALCWQNNWRPNRSAGNENERIWSATT
jgi:hypothetical protein